MTTPTDSLSAAQAAYERAKAETAYLFELRNSGTDFDIPSSVLRHIRTADAYIAALEARGVLSNDAATAAEGET